MRGQLADFLRCSLLTCRSRYARRYRQSGSDHLEKQLTDPASAEPNPRDLGDGALWITTQRQSQFGLRKVGHSFEGLIDSHLGVIADSTDNGVDL